jgi:hypothetical protein
MQTCEDEKDKISLDKHHELNLLRQEISELRVFS